jgi:hypothetical protein
MALWSKQAFADCSTVVVLLLLHCPLRNHDITGFYYKHTTLWYCITSVAVYSRFAVLQYFAMQPHVSIPLLYAVIT